MCLACQPHFKSKRGLTTLLFLDRSLLQKSPIKETIFCSRARLTTLLFLDRSLLQKSPIKETIFCSRARLRKLLFLKRMTCAWGYIWDGVDPILWHCVGSRSYEFKKNFIISNVHTHRTCPPHLVLQPRLVSCHFLEPLDLSLERAVGVFEFARIVLCAFRVSYTLWHMLCKYRVL